MQSNDLIQQSFKRAAAPLKSNQNITAVPIIEPKITRTIGLLQRRGAHLSTAARVFRDRLISKWPEEV